MTAASMTGPWWMWALLGLGNFAAATRHIVTIATYAPALVTPAPQFAPPVDAGDSRPQRPDVETGQGTSRRRLPKGARS